jgi:hypothetical protein
MRSVLGKNLGNQKNLVATPSNRLANDLFGSAGTVHFCSVNMSHAKVEPAAQGSDRGYRATLVFLNIPSALTYDRDFSLRVTKPTPFHAMLLVRLIRKVSHFGYLTQSPGSRLPVLFSVILLCRKPGRSIF